MVKQAVGPIVVIASIVVVISIILYLSLVSSPMMNAVDCIDISCFLLLPICRLIRSR